MKKRLVLTLDIPDDCDIIWLPSELAVSGWVAQGILPLLKQSSLASLHPSLDKAKGDVPPGH